MNKFKAFLGGHPMSVDDLEYIQTSIFDVFKGVLAPWQFGGSDPVILGGLVGSIVGSNTVFTAGYIAVNGEIYYVPPATVVTATAKVIDISETIDPAGDVIYEDLQARSTFIVRQGVLKNLAGGPNEIDLADFLTKTQKLQAMGAVINLETAWFEVGAPGNMAFAAGWNENTMGSEFAGNIVRYRINKNGELQLGGNARNTAMGTTGSSLLFTLATAPSTIKIYPVSASDNTTGVINGAAVVIYTTGEVYLKVTPGTNFNVNVSLDLPTIPLT